jgi:protein-S-isoprenylcysteine O-methyltransferase Ste14
MLREPVERPRLLRMAIRSESVPAGAPDPGHGVVAHIEGGFFVAGPPATPFHTVALWAGTPPGVVSVGCVPTGAGATVEVWQVHEPAGAAPPDHAVSVRRYGGVVTLTCRDADAEGTDAEGTGLVVDLLWEDG